MEKRIRGRKWMTMRREVLSANPLCVECKAKGRITIATVVDHEIALINGGTNDYSNLRGLCDDCHEAKTRKDLGQKQKVAIALDGWPVEE